MMTRQEIKTIVEQAYRLCSEKMPIRTCWLYGSCARDDYDDQSDVDILMTVDATPEELRPLRRAVAEINSRLSLEHDVTVSITLKCADSFARYCEFVPYYQNVVREGQRYA